MNATDEARACPTCGTALRVGLVDGKPTAVCVLCREAVGRVEPVGRIGPMGRMGPMEGGRTRQGERDGRDEDEVQAAIVAELRAQRHVVLVTSRRRHRCRQCGAFATSGDGCDRGIPDLLVNLGAALWLGLEVKGPRTRLSAEQRFLAADGRIRIVRSVAEALAAVHSIVSRCAES